MKKVMLSAAVCALAFSANADVADEVVVAEAIQASAFDSIYAGLGIGGSFLTGDEIGYVKTASATAITTMDVQKPKANRFIGSFVIGGGKVFNNKIYAGAEFLMDFTKNKKYELLGYVDDRAGNTLHYTAGTINGKVGGFIPQLSAKFGYAFNKCTLAYIKLGCAWTKLSVDSFTGRAPAALTKVGTSSWSKTKGAFVLGLGAEKAFCKKFSVALEGDYNFGWKTDAPIAAKTNEVLDVKNNRFNKGWTIRALAKYNVKY